MGPLVGLVNLQYLRLAGNPITDTSPLATLLAQNPDLDIDIPVTQSQPQPSGIVTDQVLAASIRRSLGVAADAPLTADVLQQLTTLEAYAQGVTSLAGLEHATHLKTLDLGANQITDLSAIENLTDLTHLYLDDNQITDITPLSGLSNLQLLRLAGNPIADTASLATLVAQNPALELDITLPPVEPDPEQPTTAGEPDPEQPTVATPAPEDPPPDITPVTFADTNLEAAVRAALRLGPEEDITPAAMLELLTLEAYDHQVVSLSGLEHATGLTALDIGKNVIVDVSPLVGLTQLEVLYLDDNQIIDVSPLSGLTNLGTLFLAGNPIETLAPIRHIIENLQTFDLEPE